MKTACLLKVTVKATDIADYEIPIPIPAGMNQGTRLSAATLLYRDLHFGDIDRGIKPRPTSTHSLRLLQHFKVGPACRAGLRGLPRPATRQVRINHNPPPCIASPLHDGSPFGESPFRQKGPTEDSPFRRKGPAFSNHQIPQRLFMLKRWMFPNLQSTGTGPTTLIDEKTTGTFAASPDLRFIRASSGRFAA